MPLLLSSGEGAEGRPPLSLSRKRIAPALAGIVALASAAASAQEPEARIRVDVNLVLLDATIKDKSGHPMKELKKEDFALDEDGVNQTIAHFSRDQLPLAVALVVDLSESIRPFIRPLRYATLTALKSLKPEDEVALFTFSSDVQRRVELTRDKALISDQIEFFETGGATNINQAIYDAAHYLGERAPNGRRVIVLVSDNVPTTVTNGILHQRVVDSALEADAAVYGLKVPGYNPLQVRMAAAAGSHGMVNVAKLTSDTGGEIFDIEKEGSLYLAFQALIERLKTRYTIGFYPARKTEDGRFRRLNLRLQPSFGTKGRDYFVLSKTGYYATSRSTPTR
jgi:Ca-activated chloride channel homolog